MEIETGISTEYLGLDLLDYGTKLFAMRLFFEGATQSQGDKIDFEKYYNTLIQNNSKIKSK